MIIESIAGSVSTVLQHVESLESKVQASASVEHKNALKLDLLEKRLAALEQKATAGPTPY